MESLDIKIQIKNKDTKQKIKNIKLSSEEENKILEASDDYCAGITEQCKSAITVDTQNDNIMPHIENKEFDERVNKRNKDEYDKKKKNDHKNCNIVSSNNSLKEIEKSNPECKFDENKYDETTDDSDIEDDLVSAINYNTITSLAALKDMLQSSGEDSEGVDSFFHHYFLSHVNRLPSRNQAHSPYPWGRRLSECREEDEYEAEEGKRIDFKIYVMN
jgi:hypothetical protein